MALKMFAHGLWIYSFAFLVLILSYAFCDIVPGEPEEGEEGGVGGVGGGIGGVGGGGGGGIGGVGGGGGGGGVVTGEPEEGEKGGVGGGGGVGGVGGVGGGGVVGGGGGFGGVGGVGGGGGGEYPEISVPHLDPEIVAKALLCFNDKYIYKSCEESYRLTAHGDLGVSTEQTEAYCGGPCLSETHLVLNCIDKVLTNFLFYNKATIQDVRDTIHAGCGFGPERGNFNVAQHIQAEEDASIRVAFGLVLGFMLIIGHCVLFFNFM